MKAAWHELGRLCLVTALCLVAWAGAFALPARAQSCEEVINDGAGETTGMFPDDVSLIVCPGAVLATAKGLIAMSYALQASTDPTPTATPSAT